MPATMKDVAELSGVCAATVSKYLSGVRVKEKNRKAIEEAVAKLHFKPNAFARNLRTNTSMTVGILLPELDNIFSMTIISHLENSLISQGYSTVICDYKTNAAHECEKLRFLLEKKVDGLVVMPFSLTANQLNDIPVPIVLIDRKVEGFLGSTVLLNNAEAAFEAVSSLIEQANSRIGILCGPQDIYTTRKRLEGYLNAHRAYGLAVDDSLVLFGQYDRESGYALTKALLSSENPPTALFATNNETTIGAVLALNDMGFTIGKDIGFVGFDSLEGSQIYPPHFSIVLQPLREIADETARLLLSGIKKEQTAQEVCLKAKWIPQGEFQNYSKMKEGMLMLVKGTYFQDSQTAPIAYGNVEIQNPLRRRLRGEPEKTGVIARTVLAGFCGTDFELMHMSEQGRIRPKFPAGQDRLINGHEGVVWVPSENRFAIVLIRGGDAYDPTRYEADETYFEYGCDQADGLMCEQNYYNPDMLLRIPEKYVSGSKIPLSIAKRLIFADPYGCMLFQYERMADLGSAHLFRIEMAKHKCDEKAARELAEKKAFDRVVIFGLGTTGMFMGDIIRRNMPHAKIVFVARSPEASPKIQFALEKAKADYVESRYDTNEALANAITQKLGGAATMFIGASGAGIEHTIAFEHGVLGNNGIYNSFSLGPQITFDTMPFGFKNHLIFGSINFRQSHMEEAIALLCESDYDCIVSLIDFDEFANDPVACYKDKIYAKNAPIKSAVVWQSDFIDFA